MDHISGLPDELLVRILSFVPTKVAVSTSILSNRWKFLWMWLSKLDYTVIDDSLCIPRDFINKNLPLHRAPVIESLRLALSDPRIEPQDIKLWVEIAVSRHVRELEFCHSSDNNENMFPSSLFTCKSLVILRLMYVTLMDVPSMVCLPSLKTLQLETVTFAVEESFQALLSISPVLEDLDVRLCEFDNMQKFTVIVQSLQKLSLYIPYRWHLNRYEIDTPSLEYLRLEDCSQSPCLFKSMPKLREAHVEVFELKSVIRLISSVKHLTVCSWDVYGDDIVFDQLEHLELCVCEYNSPNVLAQFLKDSPNLRVLDISQLDSHGDSDTNEIVSWNEPSCVPECMLSSLQIFNWSGYFGRPKDRDIAVYILKNARHLRTATIWADPLYVPKRKMVKELKKLTLSSRASSTCELVFERFLESKLGFDFWREEHEVPIRFRATKKYK